MNIRKNAIALWSFIESCVFPDRCVGCGVEGQLICVSCEKNIPKNGMFFNMVDTPLSGLIALGRYGQDDVVTTIVHDVKYGYIDSSLHLLEDALGSVCVHFSDIMMDVDVLVPVPLHKKRHAVRGFNQAEDIAQLVSKCTKKNIIQSVVRKKHTKQQARCNRSKRLLNVQDAFMCKNNTDVLGKHVLLVDDVYTTGATMSECARVLRGAGAKKVSGFVLAKGG